MFTILKIYENEKKYNKKNVVLFFVSITLFALLFSGSKVVNAQQDPMFTQYMFNTQTINPAYAGTWESVGFLTMARKQWVGFDGAPETYLFSVQAPLKNEKIALGLNLMSDKVGLEKRFGFSLDYSYQLKLNLKTSLRLGLKGGFTNYSNNLQQYQLFPNGLVDPLFQGEINSQFMPNFGIGAFLYSKKYYAGLSIPKLIHNEFENNYNNYSVQAEMRHFYLMGGMVFDLGENIKFKPTLLSKFSWANETSAPLQVDLSGNFLIKDKIWLGGMLRTGDSYGFIAQWIFNNKLRLGYAVDFTTTNLKNYHSGTHEIMISYELRTLKEKFVSPRYF